MTVSIPVAHRSFLELAALLISLIRLILQPIGMLKVIGLSLKMGWRSNRGLLRHLAYTGEAIVLAAWCRRDDIQHLYAHFVTNPAAIAMLASRLSGIPFRNKIRVIRCGLDASFFRQNPIPLPSVPRFVCVGRLGEQKAQLVLVEAARRLRDAGVK